MANPVHMLVFVLVKNDLQLAVEGGRKAGKCREARQVVHQSRAARSSIQSWQPMRRAVACARDDFASPARALPARYCRCGGTPFGSPVVELATCVIETILGFEEGKDVDHADHAAIPGRQRAILGDLEDATASLAFNIRFANTRVSYHPTKCFGRRRRARRRGRASVRPSCRA
jgi:hypothetical protein